MKSTKRLFHERILLVKNDFFIVITKVSFLLLQLCFPRIRSHGAYLQNEFWVGLVRGAHICGLTVYRPAVYPHITHCTYTCTSVSFQLRSCYVGLPTNLHCCCTIFIQFSFLFEIVFLFLADLKGSRVAFL